MKKIDEILFFVLIGLIPIVLVSIISLIFLIIPFNTNEIIQSYIVMIISFILIPSYLILNRDKIKICEFIEKIGIKSQKKVEVIFLVFCFTVLYLWLDWIGYNSKALVMIYLQVLAVAISEEIWARGILFYILYKITSHTILIIFISSFVFTFITHINRNPIENLVYRLPGALLMGIIYSKTGKIQYSISFHFIYNVLGSI